MQICESTHSSSIKIWLSIFLLIIQVYSICIVYRTLYILQQIVATYKLQYMILDLSQVSVCISPPMVHTGADPEIEEGGGIHIE